MRAGPREREEIKDDDKREEKASAASIIVRQLRKPIPDRHIQVLGPPPPSVGPVGGVAVKFTVLKSIM